MSELWKEQFQIDKILLNHPYPEHFWIVWWQKDNEIRLMYLLYRTIFCLYFVATFVYVVIGWCLQKDLHKGDCLKCFIHISYWVYFLDFLTSVLGFCVCSMAYDKQRRNLPPEQKLSNLTKVYWYFYTATVTSSIVSLGGFFIGVAPYEKERFPVNTLFVVLHIPNAILYVIDFFLVAFPFRFWHTYMGDILYVTYFAFALIYERSGGKGVKGGRPIFEWLDFDHEFFNTGFWASLYSFAEIVLHHIFSLFYMMKLILMLHKARPKVGLKKGAV